MGAEIDRLEIAVESKATKVNNSLDTLVTKLDRVSGALSRLNSGGLAGLASGVTKFAQASAQFSNVKTADFTRLAKNIEKLSSLNSQQLYGASHAMRTLANAMNGFGSVSANSVGIADFASSISKLGGANVQRAITNLPALGAAMNDLMTTLSRAPQVSDNIIRMTAALAGLAAQGNKVGIVSNSLTKNVNNVGNAMSANAKKAKSLASAIGSLYQQFFWVSRGIDKLRDSVENSMSYVENLNYFNAAFEQVADAAVAQWEDAGYSSADAYYESFSSRAKELTSGMTGFSINDDGTLTATGEASLGINPSKLMNYQAMFAQMSSSMGVTSETSLKLSQALTEIGADLASVKNMDFDKVWSDMASGLAGMSRTLDKYGANIRNVNLQQELTELGIEANITALNQNDKALLRAIILLDSTRYAWGDLADTINQPANQMRLLTNNLSNLSRTIGNLFLPVLSKVLPYVNGLVIALQRLATWIGNMMGLDISEITNSMGESEVDIGGLLDETDSLGNGLDDASASAKKLKSNLQGFDELNVINTQDTNDIADIDSILSSGLLDAAFDDVFSEYQAEWDKAFAEMENKAQAIADKIEKIFQPIKDIFNNFSVGDFFKAGQDTSSLVSGIFNFFADAIDKVDWEGIGNDIGEFIEGINWTEVLSSVGNLIWEAINAGIELWEGAFDAAPIETTIISAIALLKFTGLGSVLWSAISKAITSYFLTNKDSLMTFFGNKIKSVIPSAITIGSVITLAFAALEITFALAKPLSKALLEWSNERYGYDFDTSFIDDLDWGDIFDSGFKQLKYQLTENPWFTLDKWAIVLFGYPSFKDMINELIDNNAFIKELKNSVNQGFSNIKTIWNKASGWFNTNVITPIVDFFKGLWSAVSGFFVDLWNDISTIWENVSTWFSTCVIEPVVSFFQGLWTRVQQIFEGLWIIVQAVWEIASTWFNDNVIIPVVDFFQGLWEAVSGFFSQLWEDIKNIWGDVSEWFNTTIIIPVTDFFEGVWINVKAFFSNLWEDIKSIWTTVTNWFNDKIINPVQNAFEDACDAISGFFSGLWDSIKSGVVGAMNAVIGGIESAINFIVGGLNDIISGFNEVVAWAAEVSGEDWGGVELVPSVSIPRISWYETGGFLPSSFSLVGAGENGIPEILGSVGGKPAIAGGEEITGIADAVYSTGQTEANLLQTAVNLLQIIAEKEYGISENDIGKSARNYAKDYYRRTGKPAYDF